VRFLSIFREPFLPSSNPQPATLLGLGSGG
jgi:hypothetical protein